MGLIANMRKARAAKARRAEINAIKRENRLIAIRNKYLPGIKKIARRYHAHVTALDTACYISKKIDGREYGVHINYGEKPAVIIRKLEKAFTPSAQASRVIKGISGAAAKAVKIRKELDQASKDIKAALGSKKGNMWTDPNYFRGR